MPLKYRQQSFNISGHEITLRVLRDLSQFDDLGQSASKLGISRDAFPLFGIVWASSEVLAHYLSLGQLIETPNPAPRILEVGCGMALASHLLNGMGHVISAMDIHPIAGDLLATNAALNRANPIPFFNASWSDPDVHLGEFDLIVGSDILYEPRHVKHLAGFVDRHAAERAHVIIVDPDRGQSESLRRDLSELGFRCQSHRPPFIDHLEVSYSGDIYQFSR